MKKETNKTTSEAVIQLLSKRGIIGDSSIKADKARIAQQKKRQTAYHNTELLLKHYKNIAWMIECFPETIEEELEDSFENVDEMLEKLDVELSMENRKLENKIASIQKTRLVLDRINDALSVLKRKPEDGERLYELIYLTYIAPENLTHNELLYRLNLSSRHYYRLREQAISILSIRLWSAPGKAVDLWLEMLSALEQ